MKTKEKIKCQKVFLLLALPVLLAMFFIFCGAIFAKSGDIIINEIQINGGTGKSSHDYIELYNKSDKAINIGGWQLKKRTTKSDKSGFTESSIREFPESAVIPAEGYFLWANKEADLDGIIADLTSTATIASNNSIALFDKDKNIVDQVAWGTGHMDPFVEDSAFIVPAGKPERIGRKNFEDSNNNENDFKIIETVNPQASGCLDDPLNEKCSIIIDPPPKIEYPDGIYINEIYPYTNIGEEEFIELYNSTDEDIDLKNWILNDASKTGRYVFPEEKKIEKNSYLVIYKNDFKFALNNSGNESVKLLNPSSQEVSRVNYDGSKKGISYSFNGSDWHWTKFLTPKEDNIFEDVPTGTLRVDKNVYLNVYANFAVLGLKKEAKATWDFGDGHKSYLQKTKHKYEELGIYNASVKFSQGSEDVIKNFTVEVGKVPHPDVHIVSFKANPKGSDVIGESITLKNNSKKKINLLGWSIATGAKKKLTNHPINFKIVLKKKETKEITKQYSKFSLNNKKGKIELRYPDGKVAYKIKYDKGKESITEDEEYKKIEGGWGWIRGISNDELQSSNEIENDNQERENTSHPSLVTSQFEDIKNEDLGKQSVLGVYDENMIDDFKNDYNMEFLNIENDVFIKQNIIEVNEEYFFTFRNIEEQHYANIFLKDVMVKLNSGINSLLNLI